MTNNSPVPARGYRKRYRDPGHCFVCGKVTESPDYIVNPGGDPVIKCCCEEHFREAEAFIESDARFKQPFWVALFVMCMLNLVVFGLDVTGPVAYVPLLGIAVLVFIWPSVFTRYALYSRLGLRRTRLIFRVLAVLLGALAVASAVTAL